MMRPFTLIAALVAGIPCFSSHAAPSDAKGAPVIFAAASLRDVMSDLAKEFEQKEKLRHPLQFNFAASNDLAHQIVAADLADVFISANEEWLDFVDKKDRVVAGTRRIIVANSLVIVGHPSVTWSISRPEELSGKPFQYLSIADPKAVPAGRYAKAYLEKVSVQGGSLWDQLASKVAPALDVRAALVLVQTTPSVVGIVYRTDVSDTSKAKILYEIPMDKIPPIHYFAARINKKTASPLAQPFLSFLTSDRAQKIFRKYGFLSLPKEKAIPH